MLKLAYLMVVDVKLCTLADTRVRKPLLSRSCTDFYYYLAWPDRSSRLQGRTFKGAAEMTIRFNADKSYFWATGDAARARATGGTICRSVTFSSLDFLQNVSRSNAGRPQ